MDTIPFAGGALLSPCTIVHSGHSAVVAHLIASGFMHRKSVTVAAFHAPSVLAGRLDEFLYLPNPPHRMRSTSLVTYTRGTHEACPAQ